MKQKNNDCSSCFAIAGLAVGAYFIYEIVRFFLSPNGIRSLLEFLKYAGMCLGLFILAFIIFGLYMRFFGGTSPNKITRLSKDYAVRCYPVDMDTTPGDLIQANLSVQEAVRPLYLLVSLVNYGLSLAAFPEDHAWKEVGADNASLFYRISGNRPGPIILPTNSFDLYYAYYRKNGDFTLVTVPSNEIGFTGNLPAERGSDWVKIIIVNTSFLEAENFDHAIIREHPLRLEMVALDENGQDDPAATCELYNAVFQFIQPAASDDDDSWMYRSRPIYW